MSYIPKIKDIINFDSYFQFHPNKNVVKKAEKIALKHYQNNDDGWYGVKLTQDQIDSVFWDFKQLQVENKITDWDIENDEY